MDIEDLFREGLDLHEETKDEPNVIPEFGPCSIDNEEEKIQ